MSHYLINRYFKNTYIRTSQLILFYPLIILFGKIIRWTIMKPTLIDFSGGWGYIDSILNKDIVFKFFSLQDVINTVSDSENNAIAVFKLLNRLCFNLLSTFTEFEIMITILLNFIIIIMLFKIKSRVNIYESLFIMLSVGLINVYSASLGKEAIQMLYFVLLFMIFNMLKLTEKQCYILSIVVILFSVFTFRVYYVLIIYFSVILHFGFKIISYDETKISKINVGTRLFFIAKILLFVATGHLLLLIVSRIVMPSLYIRFCELLLFASDATSNSNTYIVNIVTDSTSNPILVWLEYLIMVIRMMIPLELINKGPKYMLFIIFQIITSISLYSSLYNYKQLQNKEKASLILFVGFIYASACFEVDYGAWVRHEIVTFPILLYAFRIVEHYKKQLNSNGLL